MNAITDTSRSTESTSATTPPASDWATSAHDAFTTEILTPSHRTFLAQARRDLAAFAGAERDFVASNVFRLAHGHDMRGGRYVVRAHVAQPVPAELVQLAADIARTLHRALDELATSLAGAPVSFPIYESLVLFAQRSRKAISRMSDGAQATIEALQPYHEIGGFEDSPLWRLKTLDTAEAPWLTGSIRDGAVMGVNTARSVSLTGDPVVTSGAFADGAIVASAPARIIGPDPKLDMFLRADFALAYPERGPGRGRDVLDLLSDLCDHLEHEVFAALEPAANEDDQSGMRAR